MPEFPSGTVAFLFTDIQDSAQRWARDPATMQTAVDRSLALLDEAVAANHGVRYKTIADAAQAAFPTVPDALAAALTAQRAMLREPWDDANPLRLRMAIHVGAAEPRGGDYLAPALNRLARLLATGYGGQILVTQAAANLADGALPGGSSLRSLGPHRLRDLQRIEEVFQLVHPDLPADFPSLRSLEIPRHNLPPPATPLIGRDTEAQHIVDLMRQPAERLVTLTGPGGVGKTRLALQVAAELVPAFPDGVWFVDLAPLDDPALVLQSIARVLGVHEDGGLPLHAAVIDHIKARSLLLVLDNFEHLITVAPLVAELLAAAPASKALITSRAPLRLRDEREIDILPLGLPHELTTPVALNEALASAAVQLFVARAAAMQPGFALTPDNAPAVVEICRRLDGLPLAIELAAARVRILPPQQLLARLDDRLRLLTGGPRDVPSRQQTLRQTIAWSHDLLEPEEQVLFRRLAVFAGHPTLATIEAVVAAQPPSNVPLVLEALVQESLVQETADDAAPRFGMLQTIRAFALEQLAAAGEESETRNRHASFFAGMVECTRPELFGPEQEAWFDRFERDHDDLRGALRWLLAQEQTAAALRFAGALWPFWLIRGYPTEGRDLLAQTLTAAAVAEPLARSLALVGAGTLAGAQGDYERASLHLEEALSLARAEHADAETARALAALAILAEDRGDMVRAAERHAEALALYHKAGDQTGVAQELIGLGTLSAITGQHEQAKGLLDEAGNLARALGDEWGYGHARLNLGRLAFLEGDLATARCHSDDALAIFRDLEDDANTALSLANLGDVALLRGETAQAASLYREALDLFRALDDKRNIAATLLTQAEVAITQGDHMAAVRDLRESAALARDVDDREGIARALEVLSTLTNARGATDQSVRALAAADALRGEIGVPLPPIYRTRQDQLLATARDSLGEAEFQRIWTSGRAFNLAEAVSLAMSVG